MDNQEVTNHTVPKLVGSNLEPLYFVECHFLANASLIEEWFKKEWQTTVPPIYGSVDLRNAGFKIAPIDMNLFPAGFNNLNPDHIPHSVSFARDAVLSLVKEAKRIIVIPENHTRNQYYWENIASLYAILVEAGFVVRFGSWSDDIKEPLEIKLESGKKILIEPLIRDGATLSVANFMPDLILLNNDLSEGIPAMLENLACPLVPPAELGWSMRLKSEHFQYYAEVASEFTDMLKMDSWLISPLFRHCGQIDFMQQEGLDCLIANAEILFEAIQKKYTEYKIDQQPFLIVKADAGTYGMAVMTIRNVDELKALNRKQRTRMSTIKGGQPVRRVIIQEGVYTFETVGEDKAVAEPVVYLWGKHVAGGFYRVHKGRSIDESLNAPGMEFEPLTFQEPCNKPRPELEPDACPNRFYMYGVIARLSMLAAAREMRDYIK